jgi:hypothetical protein
MKSKLVECEKLSSRTEEWNHIYPFMEWLQEQGLFLCRNDTEEDAKARGVKPYKDGTYFVYESPLPISKSIEQLLYEYFDVDAMKLEQERRQLLAKLRGE